jgi:hypothetical protein
MEDVVSCIYVYFYNPGLDFQLPNFVTLSFSLQNRSGRFLLQSPENILPRAAIMDCEEALNKGSTSATEVFSSLRTRSILHLFAASGSFFGLKVVYMLTYHAI